MSILTYNGITFKDWLTVDFAQEAVYDESQTDWMYDRITISGTAVITSGLSPSLVAGDSPVTTIQDIRQTFMQPRKAISFTVNGTEMMPAGAGTGNTVDAKNGPLPQFINITQISEAAFFVSVKIISHWVEKPPLTGGGGGVVSHRWRETVTLDQSFYTKYTRTGKIVIASDSGMVLDLLREQLVCVSIQPGFMRVDSEYIQSDNGLELAYSIKDQEVFREPPFPASTCSGYYQESTASLGVRHGECHVTLNGPNLPQSDPGKLLKNAIQIAMSKLRAAGLLIEKGSFLLGGFVSQELYENSVTVGFKARLHALPQRVAGVAMNLKAFATIPIGSEPGTPPPDPKTRGTAGVLMWAAAYNDPTLEKSLNRQNNLLAGPGAGKIPGGGGQ